EPAAAGCPAGIPAPAGRPIAAVPWPQRRYQPQRLAGVSEGAGVTVAVIDSGVDAHHPQLRGRVIPGHDYLPGAESGDGRVDCVSHGTAVASIIAGAPVAGIGFAGLAPGVRILPLRVTETVEGGTAGRPGTAAGLAEAIGAAVRDGARVLNISMLLHQDDPQVRAAVAEAVRRGAVLVAAVGNEHAGRTAGGADPVPYPAGYPGVLGVGAVDENGERIPGSQVGSYVDIMAPGVGVTVAVAGGGLGIASGTSYATAFVSATAALVLARTPLSGQAVVDRILSTADPVPDGSPSQRYGFGILNPYRAVTGVAAGREPAGVPVGAPVAPGSGSTGPGTAKDRTTAVVLAATGLGSAALVLFLAVMLPRGAQREWRAGRD
ncbi:MAG: S8 family serine peptidase, partial [Micromonosporaceae bacterium]|nr:S8 family serine peptidase [Micromonosporaceae bacterium]